MVPPLQCTPLGLALSFSGRVDPAPHQSLDNEYFVYPSRSPPFLLISLTQSSISVLSLYLDVYFSLYHQIIVSPHPLVFWRPVTIYPKYILSLSLHAVLLSPLRSNLIALPSMPRFSLFYFTPIQSDMLISLSSICSALPDPSPLFSYQISTLMILSAYFSL